MERPSKLDRLSRKSENKRIREFTIVLHRILERKVYDIVLIQMIGNYNKMEILIEYFKDW